MRIYKHTDGYHYADISLLGRMTKIILVRMGDYLVRADVFVHFSGGVRKMIDPVWGVDERDAVIMAVASTAKALLQGNVEVDG